MPDEPRRIILEKSSTVKRRYQRSNQRFQFTAAEIARLDREEEREKKAKQLREKEKKRIATKKRKAEQEARAREERRRRGPSEPCAYRVPSSQPLLSMFLGKSSSTTAVSPAPAPGPAPTHTTTEVEAEPHETKEDTDPESAAGDTEAESDAFDDLDEEPKLEEYGLSELGAGIVDHKGSITTENNAPNDDDDEFSDCSVFEDDAITTRMTDEMNEKATNPALPEPALPQSPSRRPETVPALSLESSFGGPFEYEAADFFEAEAAITQTPSESRARPPLQETPHLRPLEQPRTMPALASFGDSFRDETADWIEEAFACGGDDPFVEPNKIPLQ
ncbi:unnamed protein product [Penicillium salamii]|uniref:Uncharacterized protein n=1 Tax=Penicillium salamii TaxID=1612424 RepID=A0A9W4I4L0_9EURO|nr:unnamed protein product [Penicillium salamii]CAG7968370.1 unnamed protein product [Penicillium salamii]CAG8040804.1 unnamed protein product [Penicillium salamii]CAG8066120.1 unnamed protein product [Penicillium salamii]CAG8160846.1 unnamed protein product [Penicillium salamii]